MTARYRPLLDDLGLTYPQYLVLIALSEDGPSSVTHLGDRLRLDSGTLSPLLKRLESRKYVARRRAENDERTVVISLTERGEALQEKADCIPTELLTGVDVDSYDLDDLRTTLHRLVADLTNPRNGVAS